MGLFDIFKKKDNGNSSEKNNGVEFLIPMDGNVISIDQVPDEVFSKKMLGDGFAVEPKSGSVYSPVSGEIVADFPTKHAYGIKTSEGIEVLIHIGIDTVNLKGEGFTAHVKVGDKVKAGDLLVEVDFNSIQDKVPSITTPIIFTNIEGYSFDIKYGEATAKASDIVSIKKGE